MARQRFIWPSLWDDPDLGRLSSDARLLYIGCFSLADDDGRIIGDPTYLRTQIFRYRKVSDSQIVKLRDEVAEACGSFLVYTKDAAEYIAFRNWDEFQKPKYPRPSKLPPPPGRRKSASPLGKSSGNGSEPLPNHSSAIPPRDGLGLSPLPPKRKRTRRKAEQEQATERCPICNVPMMPGRTITEHLANVHDQTTA